jgi:hypothetical protein
MDKELKDQLDGLKADLEAKMADSAKAEVLEQLKGINDKMAEVETKAATAKDAEIQELKSTIGKLTADLTATVKGLEILDARVKHSKNAAGPAEVKTWEKAVQEAVDEKHDDLQKFLRKETKKVGIELKAVADFSTANVTGSSVWGAQYRPGIIANPNQIGHMRNFLPTFAAGPGTDYYFMKENGNGEGAPAPTAEKKAAERIRCVSSGLKPSFDMDFVESSVKFETIAGIMPISRKALRNIPGILTIHQYKGQRKMA